MEELENLLARRQIIQDEITRSRINFKKLQDKIYTENMWLRDVEIKLIKYYEEDEKLADAIYKLSH